MNSDQEKIIDDPDQGFTRFDQGQPQPAADESQNFLAAVVTIPVVFLIVVMGALAVLGQPGRGGNKPEVMISSTPAFDSGVERQSERDILHQPASRANAAQAFDRGVHGLQSASLEKAVSTLQLAGTASISSIALNGDRVALTTKDGASGELIVYGLTDQKILYRVKLEFAHGAPTDSARPDTEVQARTD